MDNKLFYAALLIVIIASSVSIGGYYAERNFQEPVKAKIMTDFGCMETDSTTIEEWYFSAKFYCNIGECDRVRGLCN